MRTRESLRVDRAESHFYGAPGSANGLCSLGDEAKLTRSLEFGPKDSHVWVVLRARNVLVDVRATMGSARPPGHGKVPSYATVEAGTVAAAQEAVAALHAASTTAPSPRTTDADGEISRVHDVCRAVDHDGARLAPGVTRRDISTAGGSSAGGCTWWENDGHQPTFTVQVEAVPPGSGTGESAFRVARMLYDRNGGGALPGRRGPGDEVKRRYFRSGSFRSVGVLVRKGNLLVDVVYGRWHRPPKAELERDVVGVAADVLAGYA